jgi:hypothetical protein
MGKEEGYILLYEKNVSRKHRVLCLIFCPGGELLLNFYRGQIICECQTNIAGPGFHAYVVNFLDKFAQKCNLFFELDDKTGYFTDRNFDQLQKHFNRWLKGVIHSILSNADSSEYHSLMICWSLDSYFPNNSAETVVTPMGRFPIAKFAEYDQSKDNFENFTKEFFVWNDFEKNARFYRNSAIAMLWSDCYFMPSSRSEQDRIINEEIVTFLEKAAAIDPTLQFPKREYIELCKLHGVKGISVDALPDYTLFESIGYRKEPVLYTIGNLKITIPGYYLFEIQKQSGYDHLFYDNFVEGWHELRLTPFQRKKTETKFDPKIFANTIDEPITLNLKGIKCRAAYIGKSQKMVRDKPYYSVIAEAFSDKQINLMTLSFDKESEKDWAFSLLNNMTAITSEEIELPQKQGLFSYVFSFLSRLFGQ